MHDHQMFLNGYLISKEARAAEGAVVGEDVIVGVVLFVLGGMKMQDFVGIPGNF